MQIQETREIGSAKRKFHLSGVPLTESRLYFDITVWPFVFTTRRFDIMTWYFDITTWYFDITTWYFDITKLWYDDLTPDITARHFDFDTDLTPYLSLSSLVLNQAQAKGQFVYANFFLLQYFHKKFQKKRLFIVIFMIQITLKFCYQIKKFSKIHFIKLLNIRKLSLQQSPKEVWNLNFWISKLDTSWDIVKRTNRTGLNYSNFPIPWRPNCSFSNILIKCTKFQPNLTIFEIYRFPKGLTSVWYKNSSPGPKIKILKKWKKHLQAFGQGTRNKCTKFQPNPTILGLSRCSNTDTQSWHTDIIRF